MATETINYSLVKPDITDAYDIGVQNGNMDVIDKTIKAHEDALTNHEQQLEKDYNEIKAIKSKTLDTGWITATLESGITTQDGQYAFKMRKIGKMVEIRGVLLGVTTLPTNSSTRTTLFNISTEYRPSTVIVFTAPADNNTNYIDEFRVYPNGGVIYFATNRTSISADNTLFLYCNYFVD